MGEAVTVTEKEMGGSQASRARKEGLERNQKAGPPPAFDRKGSGLQVWASLTHRTLGRHARTGHREPRTLLRDPHFLQKVMGSC